MKHFEEFIVISIALLSGLVSIADFAGLLDNISWVSDRVPSYILLSISSFIIFYIFQKKRSDQRLTKSISRLEGKIDIIQNSNKQGYNLEKIFLSKENDIAKILSLLKNTKDEESLLLKAKEAYKDLRSGVIDNKYLGFSWDLTISIVSFDGIFLFHEDRYINRRVSPNNNTYAEILKKRTGKVDEKDTFTSVAIEELIDRKTLKPSRLARFYYEEHPLLKYIIVIESNATIIDRIKLKSK